MKAPLPSYLLPTGFEPQVPCKEIPNNLLKPKIPSNLSSLGFAFSQTELSDEVVKQAHEFVYEQVTHQFVMDATYGVCQIGRWADLTAAIPYDVSEFDVHWVGKSHTAGFHLLPHRAYFGDDMEYQGNSVVLMWITPDIYHGRLLHYGEFTDANFNQEVFPWDYPGLVEIGRIQPKKGTCCLMDRIDPKWWHALTEQQDGRVFTFLGELRKRT